MFSKHTEGQCPVLSSVRILRVTQTATLHRATYQAPQPVVHSFVVEWCRFRPSIEQFSFHVACNLPFLGPNRPLWWNSAFNPRISRSRVSILSRASTLSSSKKDLACGFRRLVTGSCLSAGTDWHFCRVKTVLRTQEGETREQFLSSTH